MQMGSYRQGTRPSAPRPPSVFFDGTRLGLEGTMVVTLAIAIPSGLHIGLSAILGYAIRLADGLPAGAKPFTLFGFIFAGLLGVIAMSMILFFALSIPTMVYSMGLVALMLRYVGKRYPREKLASSIIGGILGLIVGIASTTLLFLLMGFRPTIALYINLFRWPQIMTVDGIVALWFSLNPLANAFAGAQIGWRLGKQIEELTQHWFW